MDTHLKRHLINEGHLTETGLVRTPRFRHCQRGCGLLLLAAINDFGQDAWLDPYPITVAAELTALLAGRRTYAVIERELVTRDAWRISHRDADREPTWVEHRCGSPPLDLNYRHIKTKTPTDYSSPPPF